MKGFTRLQLFHTWKDLGFLASCVLPLISSMKEEKVEKRKQKRRAPKKTEEFPVRSPFNPIKKKVKSSVIDQIGESRPKVGCVRPRKRFTVIQNAPDRSIITS